MNIPLTDKQQKVLMILKDYIQENKRPPTLAALKNILNLSSNQAVINYLIQLEIKGYIKRTEGARNIELVDEPKSNIDLSSIEQNIELIRKQKAKQAQLNGVKSKVTKPDSYAYPLNIISGALNDKQY